MAIATWSWIFVLQLIILVQPGLAQLDQNVSRILARRVMEGIFVRGLSQEAKTRNAFIGVAVAASVVLLAGITALVLLIHKSRREVDPEASQVPPVERPNWWMVECMDKKADWWRLSLQPTSTEAFPIQVDTKGGRTDRLKTALQLHKAKDAASAHSQKKTVVSPADTIKLPMQTVPAPEPLQPLRPKRAQALDKPVDKPYPIVSYPSLSPPKSDENKPKAPAPIVVNPALLRARGHSDRRAVGPRSPVKRRSKVMMKHARNPFLPPRTPIISRPMAASTDQLANPKLAHPLIVPRSALPLGSTRPPVIPKIRPAPLDIPEIRIYHVGSRF